MLADVRTLRTVPSNLRLRGMTSGSVCTCSFGISRSLLTLQKGAGTISFVETDHGGHYLEVERLNVMALDCVRDRLAKRASNRTEKALLAGLRDVMLKSATRSKEGYMVAFNVVRFKIKTGREQEFLDAHKGIGASWAGLRHANIIKISDQAYCIIAEWDSQDALVNARPQMIETLNRFRDTLEDLGDGRGVTDAFSGPVALALK